MPLAFAPGAAFANRRTLSLILSKASLLAADQSITDPAVASQVNRR